MEYPFKRTWQSFIDQIKSYGYIVMIINCNTRNFDDIWKCRLIRDSDPSQRTPCLASSLYINDKMYVLDKESFGEEHRKERENDYKNNMYTALDGDIVVNDIECWSYL